MRTVDWQFWFSDRFTGARNPARLPTTIQSRRIRCAPLYPLMIASTRDSTADFGTNAVMMRSSHGHYRLPGNEAGKRKSASAVLQRRVAGRCRAYLRLCGGNAGEVVRALLRGRLEPRSGSG